MWRALTPQAFRRDSLVRALESAERAGVVATDEAMAIERLGLKPLLVEGSEDNLKVTTPADLAVAESILRRMGDGRA
jgi:2-C-methyl-D-erythritol 4-phosphate cytidylyltransferase